MEPLAGIRILDLSMYLAGPYGPALLSDLGAEVIKVEPIEGEPLRGPTAAYLGWNHGKRCICIDLTKLQGQKIVHKLASKCDVVVENFRPAVAKRLRVDYETLCKINPTIIYCSITAFGRKGPYERKPGVDPLMQARSGIMQAQGGKTGFPMFLKIPVCDYTTAMLNACEISFALYHRAKFGTGQLIETSLLNAGAFLNSNAFSDNSETGHRPLANADLLGVSALDRMYATSDGWIYIKCTSETQWPILCHLIDRDDLITDSRFSISHERCINDYALSEILESVFKSEQSEAWIELLDVYQIPSALVERQYIENLFIDVQVLETGLIVQKRHAEFGDIEQAGALIQFSDCDVTVGRAAPTLGQHTGEILTELGYSDNEIIALHDDQVIA
ncbi:CoA transferase [SAR202 cluster bacterium AD-802-E10_MRT_200m]|nr:CoA transferase [SAR202 cluster bacterium AD-802-E10_MRT_200m]